MYNNCVVCATQVMEGIPMSKDIDTVIDTLYKTQDKIVEMCRKSNHMNEFVKSVLDTNFTDCIVEIETVQIKVRVVEGKREGIDIISFYNDGLPKYRGTSRELL